MAIALISNSLPLGFRTAGEKPTHVGATLSLTAVKASLSNLALTISMLGIKKIS